MKIPIVTKEWVEAIWEENLKSFVTPNDSMFNKYKASVFLNLVVTSTNFPKRQKEEIKRLINSNGGVKYIFSIISFLTNYSLTILYYCSLFRYLWVL